jgi:hypothetical protein
MIPAAAPLDPDALDLAVFTYILTRHPAPTHQEAVARAFVGDDWPSSMSALCREGLLHREGALYLATSAAVRAGELLS